MKQFICLAALVGLSASALAQTELRGSITGSIRDGGNQQVIQSANIVLLKSRDSSMVKTAMADSAGQFNFEGLKAGTYLVLVTAAGHQKTYSQLLPISLEQPLQTTGLMQLQPVSKALKDVVVMSKRPMIERKIDRTIINVEAAITNAGSTAMEVLEKSPGVSVDKDGNISLRGKQGVIVMVDGKQTYLSGTELANFLRNLPSSNLDQIEIMTNPSAKYDAAGNSGIINIKTKKNRQKGFNGSLSTAYGQGAYPKFNNSLNLNYRVNKINLFGTLSANYRERFQEMNIHRRYTNADKSTRAIFDQENFRKRQNGNYNAKIGLDYFATKKTTIGFVATGFTTPGKDAGFNTTLLKNSLGEVDSIVAADNGEQYWWRNLGLNVNFRHVFDTTGRELSADADYLSYVSSKDQMFVNTTYAADWTKKYSDALRGELPSDIRIYTAKIDYTHPLPKGLKLEAGLKFSYVSTDNTAGYFNITNAVETIDFEKTNRFQYKEQISAAYINFSRTIKKWGLQAGLRAENTHYKGYQFGNPQRNDSAFSRNYTGLFPTAYISYSANKKNEFGFSYGRRINRPDYEDLNPFLFLLDKYTYGSGNPFLRPMFSHVLELSHTHRQFLTTTLNYSYTTDLINGTFEQQGFATIVREGNYGSMQHASISVNAQLKPTKWLTSILYSEARYQRFRGALYGDYLDVNNTVAVFHMNNQFNFKKGWAAEMSGFYRTKGLEGQLVIRSMGELNLGVQKQVLKNKGTLKCNVRDLFYTRNARGNINFQQTEASFREWNDNRVVTISFNYRFGKPIKGMPKRKTGGAGEEQNRVKGAN